MFMFTYSTNAQSLIEKKTTQTSSSFRFTLAFKDKYIYCIFNIHFSYFNRYIVFNIVFCCPAKLAQKDPKIGRALSE